MHNQTKSTNNRLGKPMRLVSDLSQHQSDLRRFVVSRPSTKHRHPCSQNRHNRELWKVSEDPREPCLKNRPTIGTVSASSGYFGAAMTAPADKDLSGSRFSFNHHRLRLNLRRTGLGRRCRRRWTVSSPPPMSGLVFGINCEH
jgi:hypothetical protein